MLRSFANNPSLGGFGGENAVSSSQASYTIGTEKNNNDSKIGQFGVGSCDAFAQILKELVDNAVDACCISTVDGKNDHSNESNNMDGRNQIPTKRVRVKITATSVPIKQSNDNTDEKESESTTMMDCLRIEVSDNGCGMDDIDACVSAFSSNKIGTKRTCSDGGDNNNNTGKPRDPRDENDNTQSNAKKNNGSNTKKLSYNKSKQNTRDGSRENYTSGRYGVGLTLCLLHAQRLVPGTGASITSATASASEWTRAIYEPDTSADNIVCQRKEKFPKEREGECGTTINLLVPGGEDAQRAWSRLAEYFARFQLSIDLPCSLEVKAPTLQSTPLYIRPPAEMERRNNKRRKAALAVDSLMNESDENGSDDNNSNHDNWEGDDGFDEGKSIGTDETKDHHKPKLTKAAQQRAEIELQKKKKISLVCKAASAYKRRPDLQLANVAYSTQPIRRIGQSTTASTKNRPTLEIGLVVFGPAPDDSDNDDDHDGISEQQSDIPRNNDDKSSAKLQVVRMVNGIPLLDSSEALACGVMKKVASSTATWNSFGLNLLQSGAEQNTPTFDLNDSAQVEPFLKSTTHSLFQESQDCNQSSSDEDDFDVENMRVKRKKERHRKAKCILPAALRLGDVLMIVQIRAKPSALPLPTLSKGRLPLNDKGISDALENGVADCLRCLQRSSPGLLLTAQQLKKVERDVRYVPSVAGAIASVLCKSRRRGVFDNALNISSSWDDGMKRMGASCSENELRTARVGQRDRIVSATTLSHEEERLRVDALRSLLERRLRFVVSDEFKDAKKAEEKEKQRAERQELAAARKRAKKKKAVESDGMNSDCLDESESCGSEKDSLCLKKSASNRDGNSKDNFDSDSGVSDLNMDCRWKGSSYESSDDSSVASPPRTAALQKLRDDLDSDDGSRRSCERAESQTELADSARGRYFVGDFGSDANSAALSQSHRKQKSIDNSDDYSGEENSPRKSSHMNNARNWKESSTDSGNGYASSQKLTNPQLQANEESASKNKFGRDTAHDPSKSTTNLQSNCFQENEDQWSSDSDWSSQFGEVVSGHFFR